MFRLWEAAGSLPSVTDTREGPPRPLATGGQELLVAEVADDDSTAMDFWGVAGYTKQSDRARFVRLVED